MSRIIRCKFRCMSIDNRHDRDKVEFYAVTPHTSEPENSTFYKYTPSAQLFMEFEKGKVPEKFKPDEYYYLDMVRCQKMKPHDYPPDWSNEDLWVMDWGIVLHNEESREFKFRRRTYIRKDGKLDGVAPFNGSMNLTVDNPATFDTFGIEGDILWTFEWTPCKGDYSFYTNGEPQHVLGVPTYDDIVRLSGVKGDIEVRVQARADQEESELVDPESYEFDEFHNYIVKPA